MPIKLLSEKEGWACVTCDGGCGRKAQLRAKKIKPATFYVCNSREDGVQCKKAIPKNPPWIMRYIIFNAAAHFMGFNDVSMSKEDAAAVQRAQEIKFAGLAILAIKKIAQKDET